MGQLAVSGVISAGPIGSGTGFPTAKCTVELALKNGSQTSFGVATGVMTQIVASPSAFVPLTGVGSTACVKQGTFLYIRTDSAFTLRTTVDDGIGGTTVSTMPIDGLLLLEFPALQPLELLEIKGSGTLEYLVAGLT